MRKWIPLLIVISAVVASAVVYPRLPAIVPTHWDILGRPNGWSGRLLGAWLMPIVLLGVWGVMSVLPTIDPRGSSYVKFGGAYDGIVITTMLFMLGLHIVVLRAALGYPVAMERVLPAGMGLVFIVIGNLLPRARPNWFVGIRTPWTLTSDSVWEKTHRFGGKMFVASGLLILIGALVVPQWAHVVLIVVLLTCLASVLIYSYLEWKREQTAAGATR